MIRVHHWVGRRTSVSVPLWLAAILYVVWASLVVALLVLMAAVATALLLVFVMVALGAAAIGWVRRRRRS